jgi:uncharacterized protein YjbI with pentapeptide repeats
VSDDRFPGRGPFSVPPPEILRQLEPTRERVDDRPRPTVNFYEMDLTGIDLGGEYLAEGTFIDANFTGARLDGACLRRSMAGGILLRGASCCGTDFFKAILHEADFTGVLGHGIHFARAELHNARLDRGDFWRGDFNDSYCSGASFISANLSLCDLRNASLTGADLRRAQFGWTDLTGASLDSETRLAGANGIEYVSAGMIRFEGEDIEGDAAKELLIRLASQSDGAGTDS